MADPTITGTGAVKRAEFKLFADVGEAESPEWELQGDRIEELSLELNPNVETVTDVTGVTATTLDKYEEQTSVEPYYAKRESKLFAWLYSVVRDKKTLTDVEKTFCCVNIFAESEGKYDAWTQKAITADEGYDALSQVTVEAIPAEYADVSGVTAAAGDVLANKVFVGADGAEAAGTMPNNGAVQASIDGLTQTEYTVPAGYHTGTGKVSLTGDIEEALAAI